jgi:hypothetical protein
MLRRSNARAGLGVLAALQSTARIFRAALNLHTPRMFSAPVIKDSTHAAMCAIEAQNYAANATIIF